MDNELYCPMKMTSNPLFHLADCMEVGRHRNKDEEVNEDETC